MRSRARSIGVLLVASHVMACGGSPTERDNTVLTGFEGDWVGEVVGSTITLEIGDFAYGISSEGRWWWESHGGRLSCGIAVAIGPDELSCIVYSGQGGCSSGVGLPFLDIQSASSVQLVTVVGGELRSFGSSAGGGPCDGEVLLNWEPSAEVVFVRP